MKRLHDSKMLKKLVNHVLDNPDKRKIKSVLADGAHDTNRNFRYLEDKKIIPGIKIRRNSIVSPSNNRLRNKESRLQTKDLLKWKKKKKVRTERDGLLKRRFHLSKECLVSIPQPPGFKTW